MRRPDSGLQDVLVAGAWLAVLVMGAAYFAGQDKNVEDETTMATTTRRLTVSELLGEAHYDASRVADFKIYVEKDGEWQSLSLNGQISFEVERPRKFNGE